MEWLSEIHDHLQQIQDPFFSYHNSSSAYFGLLSSFLGSTWPFLWSANPSHAQTPEEPFRLSRFPHSSTRAFHCTLCRVPPLRYDFLSFPQMGFFNFIFQQLGLPQNNFFFTFGLVGRWSSIVVTALYFGVYGWSPIWVSLDSENFESFSLSLWDGLFWKLDWELRKGL